MYQSLLNINIPAMAQRIFPAHAFTLHALPAIKISNVFRSNFDPKLFQKLLIGRACSLVHRQQSNEYKTF